MKEADIEAYLCKRVRAAGGDVRKVQWIGRKGAPDRLVMLPGFHLSLKNPADLAAKDPRAVEWLDQVKKKFAAALPGSGSTIWVELKAPGLAAFFPHTPHERQQAREHERMREMGQRVVVIDSFAGVDELLA